jgi:hypothetical protein
MEKLIGRSLTHTSDTPSGNPFETKVITKDFKKEENAKQRQVQPFSVFMILMQLKPHQNHPNTQVKAKSLNRTYIVNSKFLNTLHYDSYIRFN